MVIIDKIKSEGGEIRQQVRQKTMDSVLAAFGFVAGLAWNEAIKALIEAIFPQNNNSVWAKLLYAFLVTIVVVLVSLYFVRSSAKSSENSGK